MERVVNPVDQMAFDFGDAPRIQDGVTKTVLRFHHGAVEVPVHQMHGPFVNPRNDEEQGSRKRDPGKAWQAHAFADALAQMLDLLVKKKRRHAQQQAEDGHPAQRDRYRDHA